MKACTSLPVAVACRLACAKLYALGSVAASIHASATQGNNPQVQGRNSDFTSSDTHLLDA